MPDAGADVARNRALWTIVNSEFTDEDAFRACLTSLLSAVRDKGSRLADDELHDSDLILPPADATIEEVRELLEGDGLIPG